MSVTRSLPSSLRQLNLALLAADLVELPDAELVGRFAEHRDEAAFAALVRRHGALVLGVCRRVLRHEQDAEDAFQATFLVFARDAASVRRAGAVGNWLYGVAYNVARRGRTARHKRAVKEQEAAARQPTSTPESVPDDLKDVLDAELNALPEKYRAAVVLCDLLGRTVERAATEVGCPPKTLGTRLARGRSLLARRLARRGVVPGCAALCVLAPSANAAISPRLIESAVQVATGSAAPVSPAVAALAAGVSSTMTLKTLTIVAVTCGLLLVGGVAMHGGFAAHTPTQANLTGGAGESVNPTTAGRGNPPGRPDHLHRFLKHVHDLFGWLAAGPKEKVSAPADDKDKPELSGVWAQKDGEVRIEFSDKTVMSISPHGDKKVIVILCECAAEKDGLVKAKVTGFEGKEEVKKAVMEKLPVGTTFSFKWVVKGDAATLEDVKGDKDKVELLKSRLEAEYTKK
jgi:RNA polymerase sigma factor (sigma-70 family)